MLRFDFLGPKNLASNFSSKRVDNLGLFSEVEEKSEIDSFNLIILSGDMVFAHFNCTNF